MLLDFILVISLWTVYCFPLFTDGETEVENGTVTGDSPGE